ncbi:MAG: SpoIIE family protein phosphatase [Thermoanaerobaculia bacterium]
MSASGPNRAPVFLALGVIAFCVAAVSIIDMYLPRPYDGVVLEADRPGRLAVRSVIPGSGADEARIRPGDQIIGIARSMIRSTAQAAALLNRQEIGESVPYLVRTASNEIREVQVELGRRQIGDTNYLYACILGFLFFFIGLFVYLNQSGLRVSQLFFVLCSLFLLFLVCRLRPASYSRMDAIVLSTGTAALLFLPPVFLNFFLIFPHPAWKGRTPAVFRFLERAERRHALITAIYVFPPAMFVATLLWWDVRGEALALISGAPAVNWWVLALYILLGLAALAINARRLPASRERAGAVIVFTGAVLGLIPFIVLTVAFSSILHTEQYLFYGVVPLIFVPVTFAYAIVRFGLLDVKVILRRSLLYTVTTVGVTLVYAFGIASFNAIFRDTDLATSAWFPIVFALTIILLFEPFRRWIQSAAERFFFAGRRRLQSELLELGSAIAGQTDTTAVVHRLVEKLPQLLELRYAALYRVKGDLLEREAGPENLPQTLPLVPELFDFLRAQPTLVRLEQFSPERLADPAIEELLADLERKGVEVAGPLASARRRLGVVLLSGKEGKMPLEIEELRLARGLLDQASTALETSMLLEERARQAELERELEIAAAIQQSLLPASVQLGAGWEVAAVCRPARQVGGDFFAELPGPSANCHAVVYGDVSGKSVSGALMMMAAKEALHSIAAVHGNPTDLFLHANKRLYELGNRSFVALGYFCVNGTDALQYVIAGQPQPLARRLCGDIEELPLPDHRLPLGAMYEGGHLPLATTVRPGEMVVAYSDGVIEAQSPDGEFFGTQRLTDVLRSAPQNPKQVVDSVLDAIAGFTGGLEPYDDVTLMVIQRQPEVS